jgi:hypothetical protein
VIIELMIDNICQLTRICILENHFLVTGTKFKLNNNKLTAIKEQALDIKSVHSLTPK